MSEPDTEHAAGPITPQTPVVSNYGLVLTVYILYLVGFLTGITVFVGVVTERIGYLNLIFSFKYRRFGLDFCIFLWGF